MRTTVKYLLASFTILFLSFLAKSDERLARINGKDGFTNIRAGQSVNSKIVGIIKQNDFFYCESTDSDWYKVTTLSGPQIFGFIYKDKVQFIDDLSDTAKKNLIEMVFENEKQFATKFHKSDSLGYYKAIRELDNYSDAKYSPILQVFIEYFCKTKDTETLNKLFSTVWADNGSANEEPSFTLGDCFICSSDIVLKQLKKITNKQELKFIVSKIDWGLRNHFNVPEDGLGIPSNTNKKEVTEFRKLHKKLYSSLK